jgi:hypothetical protein
MQNENLKKKKKKKIVAVQKNENTSNFYTKEIQRRIFLYS